MSGFVHNNEGAALAGADVRVQNELSGVQQRTVTDKDGHFVSPALVPGPYKLMVRLRGFRTVTRSGIVLQTGEIANISLVLELLPLQQEITVISTRDDSNPTAAGVTVGRTTPTQALPANGRDLHAFYSILPGAIVTPAMSGDGGQFSVNGQRPNTNTVRVDGVNGNTGVGIAALPGTYGGSSLPATSVIGSTQNLASKEEIERVELQSTDFAPEIGDRPGAQIKIETRSGTNDFHGSAFGYFRPEALDSQDPLAQRYHSSIASARLNGFGVSLGGRLFPNRTFFFAALEDVKVDDRAIQLMAVPSLEARRQPLGSYGALLNAFPLPTAPLAQTDVSLSAVSFSKDASVHNYSGRLDQIIGSSGRVFARYANVPSQSSTKQLDITDAGFRFLSATVGSTISWKSAVHDFRFNFSRIIDTSSWMVGSDREMSALGNIPSLGQFINAFSVGGIGQLISGATERTNQKQWEVTYVSGKQVGAHDLRWGGDFIRLLPRTTFGNGFGIASLIAPDVVALLRRDPLGLTSYSAGKPTIDSGQIFVGSLFAQDTVKVSNRLNLLYGVRWELVPTLSGSFSTNVVSFGNWQGQENQYHQIEHSIYLNFANGKPPYFRLAPRVGLAYHLQSPDLILRVGAGVFYDTAIASLLNPVNFSPLNSWQFLPSTLVPSSFPFESSYLESPTLSLPRVWQWRVSLDRNVFNHSTASLAYVGSVGRSLLRLEGAIDPMDGLIQGTAFASRGRSSYEALQAHFTGKLRSDLYTLFSYTWGHSIDTGSQASSVFLQNINDRASSSFDVRHNVSGSLSYRLPSWLRDWQFSSTWQAHSGFPFDVTSEDRSIGLGFANTGRPDLAAGVPIWLRDSTVPGGRRLNANAFVQRSDAVNGSLGRNALRGPGLWQMDTSINRRFKLWRTSVAEFNITAFNLFNRSSYSNPVDYLGSALFGQPSSAQSLMLGSGIPTGGLTPIFQAGGPRTVEMNIKLSF